MDIPTHIEICIANGGYVVNAEVQAIDDPEEWITTSSVFSDKKTLIMYLERIVQSMEGPFDSPQPGEMVGPLKVQEKQE